MLKHRISGRPVLLYYPYGAGTVFLASGLYSDWSNAHSQMSVSERRIVRDLITFAQDPKTPIPMIAYDSTPAQEINLAVKLVNSGETTAAKAIIKVMTPDNDRLLFETESNISLEPSMVTIVPISFTLPAITYSELGIFHTIYQLLDAEGQTVQGDSESVNVQKMSEKLVYFVGEIW